MSYTSSWCGNQFCAIGFHLISVHLKGTVLLDGYSALAPPSRYVYGLSFVLASDYALSHYNEFWNFSLLLLMSQHSKVKNYLLHAYKLERNETTYFIAVHVFRFSLLISYADLLQPNSSKFQPG